MISQEKTLLKNPEGSLQLRWGPFTTKGPSKAVKTPWNISKGSLPHSMYYSHYGNWVRNGAISIMQWVLLSDAYKVNPIGERKNSGNRNWVCKYIGAKCTLHIALSKRPINQFSKADNRC